jgi:hypothetical protein
LDEVSSSRVFILFILPQPGDGLKAFYSILKLLYII